MNEKRRILYGAGYVGKLFTNVLMVSNIPVECFCDSDPLKIGTMISGLLVKSIDEVKLQYKKGEYTIFVSVAKEIAGKVKNDLIRNGTFEPDDFCDDVLASLFLPMFYSENKNKRDYCISIVEPNFIKLTDEPGIAINALLSNIFKQNRVQKQFGFQYSFDNFSRRLGVYRESIIPWLQSIHSIKGSCVLEVGCGIGASTVALCEQGAVVTAIDIDEQSLENAKTIIKVFELQAEFEKLSAVDIKTKFTVGRYDLIIFTAAIEHMTYTERIQSIRAAFDMLSPNQYIVIVDTPNRLWYKDKHTSLEPFYHWLPDELAIEYAKFTPREGFNIAFSQKRDDNFLELARWGRGVSYHEFEIAAGYGNLKVKSHLNDFFDNPDSLYKKLLKNNGPSHIDDGFYEPELNIALYKDCLGKH